MLDNFDKTYNHQYQVFRLLKYNELARDIRRIREQYNAKEENPKISNANLLSVVSNLFFKSAEELKSQSKSVNDYWDNTDDNQWLDLDILPQVLILQRTFRVWISLGKVRANKKEVVKGSKELTILRQSAVRQWLAVQYFLNLEINKDDNDEKFYSFIREISQGLTIQMFSKTFGALKRRTLKFDSTFTAISYQTSEWMPPSTVKLNSIYDVKKGLSGYKYSQLINAHKAWCFHLYLLGGKVIDIQAEDGQQARDLFQGFKRLVLLFSSQSPFYIDKNGIPRRAGASIIKQVLSLNSDPSKDTKEAKAAASEADKMRYRNAIRLLKIEYEEWHKKAHLEQRKEEEEQEHEKQMNSSSERAFNRPSKSSAYPTDLSRFTASPTKNNNPTDGLRQPSPMSTPNGDNPELTNELDDLNRKARSRAATLRKSSMDFVFPDRVRFSSDENENINNNDKSNHKNDKNNRYDSEQESPSPKKAPLSIHLLSGRRRSAHSGDEYETDEQKDAGGGGFSRDSTSKRPSLRLILGIESYKNKGKVDF